MPRHFKNRLHPENEIGFATLALQRAKSEPQSPFHADAQSDYEPGKICCRTALAPWFARVQTWDTTVDLRLAWMEAF